MKSFKVVLCLSIMMLILAGCQEGEPDPGETVTFPQTVTSVNGRIAVGVPDGWIAEPGETQFIMANSPDARAVGAGDLRTLTADQLYGIVNFLPNSSLGGMELTAESTPREILDALVARGSGAARTETDVNNRREFRTGGHDAIISRGTVNQDGTRYGSILGLIKYSDGIILLNFNTAEDATETHMEIIEDVMRSVVYPVTAP